MPPWVRDAAALFSPVAGRASQLIEERVMAEIEASFREDKKGVATKKREELPPGKDSPVPSVADEIAKLRALRDEGALSEEQYAKAIDRAIAGDSASE
jgi:hypothetical protein